MQYRHLGRSGLKISALSLGSWVTFRDQLDIKGTVEMMAAAMDAGINFFDNAEIYADGQSEVQMGAALRELRWPRLSYLVSTKFFWGLKEDGPHATCRDTLNRKYLLHAIDGSLRRLQLDHVDLVYCHRPDAHTPIEETAWAMHDIISSGKALYWGTSEWPADAIRAAFDICERHHLHKPIVEQPQYHLFHRRRVEVEYARLYQDVGLGLTTWSPLAGGVLTGKYRHGIPDDSRGALPYAAFLRERLLNPLRNAAFNQLEPIANELACTVPQLAIAWAARNEHVSTVILGASRVSQLIDNLSALEFVPRLTTEVLKRIDDACRPALEQAA